MVDADAVACVPAVFRPDETNARQCASAVARVALCATAAWDTDNDRASGAFEQFALHTADGALNLACTQLRHLPAALFAVQGVVRLLLSSNQKLASIDGVERMRSLTHLNLACTGVRELPGAFGQLSLLTMLGVSEETTALPESIGDCAALRQLYLNGSDVTVLPSSLARCKQLRILSCSGTRRLTTIDNDILRLPSLAFLRVDRACAIGVDTLLSIAEMLSAGSALQQLFICKFPVDENATAWNKVTPAFEAAMAGNTTLTEWNGPTSQTVEDVVRRNLANGSAAAATTKH